jgi:hypothetical protein
MLNLLAPPCLGEALRRGTLTFIFGTVSYPNEMSEIRKSDLPCGCSGLFFLQILLKNLLFSLKGRPVKISLSFYC